MDLGGRTTSDRVRHPWLVSIGTALVVALVGAVLLPSEGGTFAFSWGSHSGTLLIPALGVGLLLRLRSWPWWVGVGVAAAVFVVVLVVLTMFRAALDEAGDRTADTPPPSSTSRTGEVAEDDASEEATAGPVEVAAPQEVGAWRRLGGRIDRQAQARRRCRLHDGIRARGRDRLRLDAGTVGQLTLFGTGDSVDDVVPVLHLFREAALTD